MPSCGPIWGDVLVIPLVYCLVATFIRVEPATARARCARFRLRGRTGAILRALARARTRAQSDPRTLLSTSYSTLDLVAYAVGAALSVGLSPALATGH